MIPLYQRHIDPSEVVAVNKLLKTGELSQGYYIEELETKFAKYVGAPYAVAVNSCTNAIGMCLDWYFLNHEGTVPYYASIPAMTFVSVANEIQKRTTLKLDDYIPVGRTYSLGGGSEIVDCAHEVNRDMYNPTVNPFYCFSLYPGKPLSGAEGGLIATDNKAFVEWAKSYRQCGRTAYGASYDVVSRGVKANMTNLQACIGLHALMKLDENKRKLAEVRDRYNDAFKLKNTSDYVYRINVEKKIDPVIGSGKARMYNGEFYTVDRDGFRAYMTDSGVDTSIHFKPIYYFEAYKGVWDPKDFPNTEKEWQSTVSIPFYPDLSVKDQDRVINLVQEWL